MAHLLSMAFEPAGMAEVSTVIHAPPCHLRWLAGLPLGLEDEDSAGRDVRALAI
jgi:hypothetical protein